MKTLRKLLVLAFGPVLLTLASVFYLVFELTETTVRTELDQLAITQLTDEVRHLHDVFSQAQSSLRLLALSPVIQRGKIAEITPQLTIWATNFPQPIEALYYNTAEGDVYGSDGSTFNVSDRYYFPNIQKGETVVTKVLESRASQQPVILVLLPVFSVENKERLGAIGVTIRVRNILGKISAIDPGFRGDVLLIDENGHPISGHKHSTFGSESDSETAVVLKSIGKEREGRQRVQLTKAKGTVYFETIPDAHWRLAFIYSDAEVFYTRRLVRNTLLMLLAVSLPFIFLAVLRVKKDITGPMEALAASEERWRSLVQNAPFFIHTIDDKGTILFINQVVSGLDRSKVIGTRIYDYASSENAAIMRKAVDALFTTGQTQNYEISATGPNGSTSWYASTMSPILENGKVTKAVLIAFDITGRRSAEEKALQSERRFRGIFNQTFQFIGLLAPDGTTLEANEAALLFIGKRIEEVRGKPVWETPWWTHSPLEQAKLKAGLEQAAKGEFVHFETTHRSADGMLATVDFSLKPVCDEQGKLLWIIPEGHDITVLKETVEALRRSEVLFRSIVNDQTEMIVRWKPDGTRTLVNDAYCRMFGQTKEQLIGTTFYPLISPEDLAAVKLKISRLSPQRPILSDIHRSLLPNGEIGWQEWSDHAHFDAHGKLVDIQSVGRDITERMRLEQAQKTSEANLSALVENIPGAVWSVDRGYRYISFNSLFKHGVEVITGKSPEVGTSIDLLLPADVSAVWKTQFDRALSGQQFSIEYPLQVREQLRQYEVSFNPIRNEGEITGVTVLSLDITARKAAEEVLRLQAKVLESMTEGVGVCDENAVIIYVNNAEEKMFAYGPGELLGQKAHILVHGEAPEVAKLHTDVWLELKRNGHFSRELQNRRKDGTTFYSFLSVSTLEFAGKRCAVWVREDITERRKLEQRLLQSQKMESIGQLAGGVAHDFNNILTVIQGHAGVLQLMGGMHAEAADAAAEIVRASDRASSLTKQLLAFSRQQIMQPKEIALSDTVTEMAKMLQRLLGEHISLLLETDPELPLVKADPGMMQQIVLNLAVNARDAMPGGGKLTITLRPAQVTSPEVTAATKGPSLHVCLSVTDTGGGIPEENIPRIFDPFFTTKEVGKGTGLGLATVYGIVKQHQGWVEVESVLGQGSTFRVYLPAMKRSATATTQMRETYQISRGTEKIMVVEDESSLRTLVRNILKHLGYQVVEAASAKEALEIWPEHRESVALLLTDLVMPDGISGMVLAERLTADRPGLKVIYSSGYSSEIILQQDKLVKNSEFLAKPYRPHQLAELIRRMLDKTIG